MAIGDDAAGAGMDLVSGSALANTLDTEINKSRDYIALFAAGIRAIENGGTGASSAPDARANLGALGADDTASNATPGKVVVYDANGRFAVAAPSASSGAANKGYVDAAISDRAAGKTGVPGNFEIGGAGAVQNSFDVGGHIYVPNASAATSGYVVAYINNNGRISKGASSRRYKHDIRDAQDLGDTFAAPLREFKMNDGDGTYRVGRIAEELEESGLGRYVVYTDGGNGEMVPDSIDFIGFLMAQVEQLHQRVKELEAVRNA